MHDAALMKVRHSRDHLQRKLRRLALCERFHRRKPHEEVAALHQLRLTRRVVSAGLGGSRRISARLSDEDHLGLSLVHVEQLEQVRMVHHPPDRDLVVEETHVDAALAHALDGDAHAVREAFCAVYRRERAAAKLRTVRPPVSVAQCLPWTVGSLRRSYMSPPVLRSTSRRTASSFRRRTCCSTSRTR